MYIYLCSCSLDIYAAEPWYLGILSYPLLVYIYVAGLLVVVGGVVVSDETDRVWSEALFALTCCSSNQ